MGSVGRKATANPQTGFSHLRDGRRRPILRKSLGPSVLGRNPTSHSFSHGSEGRASRAVSQSNDRVGPGFSRNCFRMKVGLERTICFRSAPSKSMIGTKQSIPSERHCAASFCAASQYSAGTRDPKLMRRHALLISTRPSSRRSGQGEQEAIIVGLRWRSTTGRECFGLRGRALAATMHPGAAWPRGLALERSRERGLV